MIHLTFNVIGAVIFGTAMYILFQFTPTFANGSIDSVGISIFHTVFNIICTAILFLFANKLVSIRFDCEGTRGERGHCGG